METLEIYPIGTQVSFVLCPELTGFVVGVTIGRNNVITYQVSYWTDNPREGMFREFEVQAAEVDAKTCIGFKELDLDE